MFSRKGEEQKAVATDQWSEIDGGLLEQNMSVFEHIEQGLLKNPNRPAVISMFQPANSLDDLVSGEKENHEGCIGNSEFCNGSVQSTCLILSYAQLHSTALKLAAGLLANGAQSDTTILMLIPNGGEYTLLLWTCILLRITYVSLDPALLERSGYTILKNILRMLKPQLVIAPDSLSGKAIEVAVTELQLPLPLRLCLSQSHISGWKSLFDVATDGLKSPFDEASVVAAARKDSPKRIHAIMFTSGTSGVPKGCPQRITGISHLLHSQRWLINSEVGAFAVQQAHNSRGIAPAQTMQTWLAGGTVVMTGQGFNVFHISRAIEQFGATFIVLTPPMVHEMAGELATRPIDVTSVKRIQVGGDTVTKDILIKCSALFPQAQVCVNHGMTEGGGSFVWPFFRAPTSHIPFFGEICPVGKVAPGSVIRIWDTEKRCVVRRGELGELHISCASIIKHYMMGRSEESFYDDEKGRWFNTGDIATLDKNGLLFILGRRKDMVKRAGVAIMPAAIESSIEAFTGTQSIVVPTPHHVLGTEPFVTLRSLNGKTEAQIKDHVRAVFGRDYTLGGLVTLKQLGLAEFPLNPTHKIIKSEVQAAVLKYLETVSGSVTM
ncbi:putative amp dependent CoA ligase [Xylogone sp. PMI_703]|nr:putative amp dependent CoA ligase [Xylogone sp. PMI_703]